MSLPRLPLMETSDNATSDNNASSPAPRRSARPRVAVQKFSPEPHDAQPKRKRAAENDDENPPSDAENDEDDVDDGDGAEPTSVPKRSRKSRKPAAKRTKVNGNAQSVASGPLAVPAVKHLPTRPKKTAKALANIADRDSDDLYAEIFASGHESNDIAGHWFQKYQADAPSALTELINTVLLASGCSQTLTIDDINDNENAASRLSELEEAYEQTSISDYPLISKAKNSKHFRDLLVGFFESLVSILHETEVLYEDEELIENIQRWTGIMSSSALRPFRHTATTVGLSMLTGLVDVMKKIDDRIAKSNQSLQAESHRKSKNKALMANTQKALDKAQNHRTILDSRVRDLFDVVFVHRYRDIDPKIRAECIEALGNWVTTLPTVYMAPEYLRYMGWLLSDVNPATRHEVLRQLAKVLSRDAEKLVHFIDRFRERLVEIATKDAEVPVRVTAINVVDILRRAGMLEPEEVDSISKMLFDSEIRVRKAVAPFFSALISEQMDNKIDDIGGADVLEEVFGDDDEDDYETLRKEWIDIKTLAENLAVYDVQLNQDQDEMKHGLDVAADVINANIPESRISLAAQALYENIPDWQAIAGYLLFDHTTSSRSRSSKSNSTEKAVKKAVAPVPEEEAILLDVLTTTVKESLASSAEHDKSRRRPHKLDAEAQEDAALHLAGLIPRLLKKYGSDPSMAATVLQLEHFLDLEVFQQLRQDSATYDQLLDEITTQFTRHVDQSLLNEAVASLLHARQYPELEELVDTKLAILWEDSINGLRTMDRVCELSMRGNLDRSTMTDLSHTLMKVSKLVRVSDCVDTLEAPGPDLDSDQPAIKILVGIVGRGRLTESNDELDDPEDEIVGFAIKACMFYFMWKVQRLRKAIENNEDIPNDNRDNLVILRKDLINNLIQTFSSRGFNDDLRLFAVGVACDITQLFIFLRPHIDGPQSAKYRKLRDLLEDMPDGLITLEFVPIFDAAEGAFAKRTNKTLNEPADDDEPLDDDLPPEDDEEEDLTELERLAAEIKAEKILCELTAKFVMAIVAKTIDHTGKDAGKLRKRILRNKNKLGASFKDIVAYLDENHIKTLQGGKKKAASKGKGKEAAKKPAAPSAEIVVDDDDDPFEEAEPEEGTAEDLRRRELLDDPIEDEEEEEIHVDHPPNEDDDEILGD